MNVRGLARYVQRDKWSRGNQCFEDVISNKSYISASANATGLQLSLCKSPRDKVKEHVMSINLDRRPEGNSLNLSCINQIYAPI